MSEQDRIGRLWERGLTAREIAGVLNMNVHTVGGWVRKLGLGRGGKRRGALAAQFEAFVSPCPNTGCHFWTGSVDRQGYGQIRAAGQKLRYATHVSLDLAGRPRPEGMRACHRCDVPLCVNADHLYWGSAADNAADMLGRGRGSAPPVHRGEVNNRAVLTAERVVEIRRAHAGGATIRGMARDLGVSTSAIMGVVHGKTWRHVP